MRPHTNNNTSIYHTDYDWQFLNKEPCQELCLRNVLKHCIKSAKSMDFLKKPIPQKLHLS